ncbi:MAG TPA: GAF domain-containing protein [Sphingomicrobium sp.]|nr:GAF domain-containing protein [Sphingomicrobium sp.]
MARSSAQSDWTAVRLATLVELNDRIREFDDPGDVAYAAAELLGQTLGVSRAGYGTIDPEAETIVIERDWNAPGIQSLAGTLQFRDYGSYIEDLKRGETVVFADAEKDPRTAAAADALKAISAQSVVNMPIREQGGLVALLYLNHATAREWGDEELALIRDVAERTRSVVERRRVENRLRDGEERFRTVFENAAVGMLEIDADWSISAANAAYGQLVGIPPERLSGQNCLAFTHPDDVKTSEQALHKAAAGPKGARISFEKRYIHADGHEVWIRSNLAKISGQGPTARFLKVVEDISDAKRAQAEVEDQRHLLEILNETGAAVAAELDTEAIVQKVTDAGVELTGAKFGAFFYNVINEAGESLTLYTLTGADRADFDRFGHPRATQVFAPTFRGEGVVRSDDITSDPRYGKNPPHNGLPRRHLPVRSYLAVPVTSRTGEVIGGLFFGHPDTRVFTEASERLVVGLAGQAAVAIDNSRLFESVQRVNQTLEERVHQRTQELEEAHEALRQSQKMETVGQLTGGIAHDFNNLLQIVSGNLDLLRQKLPGDATHLRRYVDRAFNGADRAATLTQRLLAFSRRQPLMPKPLDINRLIPGMSELLHRTLGETIEVESVLAPRLWTVEADPNQLENAIINLAINARDAMPDGGKLTIETANTHLDHSYAAHNPEVSVGQYAVICISDTGVGMDAETAARAVEPFFTTKEVGRGTGLGLSMVYGFVKQSGGHVKIYSEPGQGTTVKMYLPRLLGKYDEQVVEPVGGWKEAQGSEVILVCEDDEDVRAYSAEVLRELGYRVLEAADGPGALALLEAEGNVDLLFTDVVLPGGMTGADLAREAAKVQAGIKTLFTTGYARNAIVHHGRLDPGVDLLTKPFSYADLAARVRDILDLPKG